MSNNSEDVKESYGRGLYGHSSHGVKDINAYNEGRKIYDANRAQLDNINIDPVPYNDNSNSTSIFDRPYDPASNWVAVAAVSLMLLPFVLAGMSERNMKYYAEEREKNQAEWRAKLAAMPRAEIGKNYYYKDKIIVTRNRGGVVDYITLSPETPFLVTAHAKIKTEGVYIETLDRINGYGIVKGYIDGDVSRFLILLDKDKRPTSRISPQKEGEVVFQAMPKEPSRREKIARQVDAMMKADRATYG